MLIAGAETLKSRAIVGNAVARIVASSCSMNIAEATISAMVRKLRAVAAGEADAVETGADAAALDEGGMRRAFGHNEAGASMECKGYIRFYDPRR